MNHTFIQNTKIIAGIGTVAEAYRKFRDEIVGLHSVSD